MYDRYGNHQLYDEADWGKRRSYTFSGSVFLESSIDRCGIKERPLWRRYWDYQWNPSDAQRIVNEFIMENIINETQKRINQKISFVNEYYHGEWNESHAHYIAVIDGMIDMLSIATGKSYVVTEKRIRREKSGGMIYETLWLR